MHQKNGRITTTGAQFEVYGRFISRFPNPLLQPEFQQGGEGGIELYFGNRGSLVVTRYNQTVEDLIANLSGIDSIRAPMPGPQSNGCTPKNDGYCYSIQSRNENAGNIRNQGWELQGSINIGPLTTRSTYSWTKSRVIGVNPEYRARATSAPFQPGYTFNKLPEHTWSTNISYSQAATTVGVNLMGTGFIMCSLSGCDDFALGIGSFSLLRLGAYSPRSGFPTGYRSSHLGYTMADLIVTQKLSSKVDALVQIQNLTNTYKNDVSVLYASIGRQSRLGMRIRML